MADKAEMSTRRNEIADTYTNRLKALEGSRWLMTYAPDAIDHLARNSRLVALENRAHMTSRTEKLDYVAFVAHGGLRSTAISVDGTEHTVSFMRDGAFMGAISLIDGEPNPLDVTAYGDTLLVVIRRTVFRLAMTQFPNLYEMIAQLLVYRLRKTYTVVHGLALEPIETRLRRSLLALAARADQTSDGGCVRLQITQEQIGHLINTTRPTVNKIIKKLEGQGMLAVRYGHIDVLDIDRLAEACDDEPIYSE